ncbi:uncharacterized protein LOC106669052 isoform X2 [Cimex lectularius]|uniref:MD-2-related lipid-recognition domain-containing protein n=1 Tax=Cimex lectularius TaxID=79782 RepID=A0A8I6SLE1_CIMLE|nr:uncharacterized protein LOC106669052 isoform X2 [Cimex lectularius]
MLTQLVLALSMLSHGMADMGPGDIWVEFVERCPNKREADLEWYIRLQKYNRSYATVSFNATLPYEFSDDLSISIAVFSKSNGAWKPNFYNFNFKGLCHSLREYNWYIFSDIAKSMNAKPQCPLPKGLYKLTNLDYMSKVSKLPSSVLPYGKFKAEGNIFNKHHKLAVCFDVYFAISPKKITRKNRL